MRKQLYLVLLAVVIALYTITLWAQNKPKDSFGKIDKAEVVIKQVKPNHFALELTWDNDEKLAAFTYPLTVKGKDFKMHYDSVSWKGRCSYFAVKSVKPVDSLQQVLVGFFADLSGTNPPLPEAKGTVATLYFTADAGAAKKTVDVCDIAVDTTFIGPSSTLYGVTPDGQGAIHPAYGVVKLAPDGKPAPCK